MNFEIPSTRSLITHHIRLPLDGSQNQSKPKIGRTLPNLVPRQIYFFLEV